MSPSAPDSNIRLPSAKTISLLNNYFRTQRVLSYVQQYPLFAFLYQIVEFKPFYLWEH